MAELATIARPYAEALFQSSKADLAGTAQWLDTLAAVAAELDRDQLLDQLKQLSSHVPGFLYQYCLRPDGSALPNLLDNRCTDERCNQIGALNALERELSFE